MTSTAPSTFRHVFEPFTINGVTVPNRIVRASQGTGITVGGHMREASTQWHLERARGGVGLIYTDPASVHWSSPAFIDAADKSIVESLLPFTETIHAEGSKVFTQLLHGGPTNIPIDGSAPWSASHAPDPGLGMLPIPMTQPMIDEVVEGFARAAVNLVNGGIDGVELHAGHGYLFSAFFSPATNQRTDDYGGSFENRARLLMETLSAVRAALGPHVPVGVRLSPDGPSDQATIADIVDLAHLLHQRGLIDFVNVSYGSHYQRDLLMGGTHEQSGYQSPVFSAVRQVPVPLIVAGRFGTLADAERVLESGLADLVSMVRATIADPELVNKTRNGRVREVRPCIACNQACAGGLNTRGKVTCTVNPAAGRELTHGDDTLVATNPGHVVIVGGGPGGMEAARAAAIAGHRVTLIEAEAELGGQLRLTGHSPHRSEIASLATWFAGELDRLGVEVRLGERVDAPTVLDMRPDAVIVATGATPRRDGFQTWLPGHALPGLSGIELLTGWDVLLGAAVGRRVLLLDEIGHYESLDVAELLTEAGHEVHLVTRFSNVAANLEMRWEMIGAPHVSKFLKGEFHLHGRSLLVGVGPGHAEIAPIEARDRVTEIPVDSHVLMSGSVPDRTLQSALAAQADVPVRIIGDAVGPRLLEAAVFEGNHAVRSLEPGALRRVPGVRFGQSGSAI